MDHERDYWGTISVTKNGQPWRAQIIGLTQLKDWPGIYTILLATDDPGGRFRTELQISGMPLDVTGTFSITRPFLASPEEIGHVTSLYGTIPRFDVLRDIFHPDTTSSPNTITITERRRNEVKGHFDITLARTAFHPLYERDDILRFQCEAFHTRITPAN